MYSEDAKDKLKVFRNIGSLETGHRKFLFLTIIISRNSGSIYIYIYIYCEQEILYFQIKNIPCVLTKVCTFLMASLINTKLLLKLQY